MIDSISDHPVEELPATVVNPSTARAPVVAANESASPADRQAVERVDRLLEQLDELAASLTVDSAYQVPDLDYVWPEDCTLSVVIPVYNEESTVLEILGRVRALPIPKEIVVVDDCSTDRTRSLLEGIERLPDLRVVLKPRNEGKGAALRTGFQVATGTVIVVQDADLEYDPRDIPRVLRPIVDGEADVVYGSRFLGEEIRDPSFVHRLGNGLLTWASNRFTGLRLTDMETCYKAFHRNVLQGIEIRQDRFGFEPEFTAKVARRRFRIREVPIAYEGRGYDQGKKIGIRDAINALYCVVRYGLAD